MRMYLLQEIRNAEILARVQQRVGHLDEHAIFVDNLTMWMPQERKHLIPAWGVEDGSVLVHVSPVHVNERKPRWACHAGLCVAFLLCEGKQDREREPVAVSQLDWPMAGCCEGFHW